jgi:hypothetical protein
MIELSAKHVTKSKHGKKRPGGPDLWQTVYLGVSEIFVTGDEGLIEAASSVSAPTISALRRFERKLHQRNPAQYWRIH